MKFISLLPLALLAVTGTCADEAVKAEVAKAVMGLADVPNYTWKAVTDYGGDSSRWKVGPAMGRTEKDGYSYLAFTMGEDNAPVEVAIKGTGVALKFEGDWRLADQIEGRGRWMAQRFKQFQVPADEAREFLSHCVELRKGDDGWFKSDITGPGLDKTLERWFGRDEGRSWKASGNKGWVRFRLANDKLAEYEFKVGSTLTVGDEERKMSFERTTRVTVEKIGDTKVEVPDAARALFK